MFSWWEAWGPGPPPPSPKSGPGLNCSSFPDPNTPLVYLLEGNRSFWEKFACFRDLKKNSVGFNVLGETWVFRTNFPTRNFPV